ncbi:MAG: hypothetical protein Q7S16_04620 [bacterium]|nr:hypothetical protein [bacterium]
MDEDIRQLLEKNIELTERIARDVKKMRHHFWMANIYSIIKLFIFIILPLYLSYLYITPYMGQLQGALQQVQDLQKNVSSFQQNIGGLQKNLGDIQGATSKLKDLQKQMPSGESLPSMPSIPGLDFLFGGKK